MFCESLHKTMAAERDPLVRRFFPPIHPKDRKSIFAVNHFAGRVTYTVGEKGVNTWLTKNHDTIPEDMPSLLNSSIVPMVCELGAMSLAQIGRRKQSVADGFSLSMADLCKTLKDASCAFIRCIKPNQRMMPLLFDPNYVVHQVRALGLVQVCEVMKVGLNTRITYNMLRTSLPDVTAEIEKLFPNESNEIFAAVLLSSLGIPDEAYHLGRTRVFFKAGQTDTLDRLLSTDFASKRDEVMSHLQQARLMRLQSTDIVQNLESNLQELDEGIARNGSALDSIVDSIEVVDSELKVISQDTKALLASLPRVMSALSTAESQVNDAGAYVEGLSASSSLEGDYREVADLIGKATAVLTGADAVWSEVDDKSNIVSTYLATNPVDALRLLRADVTNDLADIVGLMPDVQYLAQKTILDANRCQLTRMEKRAADCRYNVEVVRERLEINGEDIDKVKGRLRVATTESIAMANHLSELKALTEKSLEISVTVKKLCDSARVMASSIRAKLVQDEEERLRLEAEALQREEELRRQREEEEEELRRIEEERVSKVVYG
jgi:myosin heavy subunit